LPVNLCGRNGSLINVVVGVLRPRRRDKTAELPWIISKVSMVGKAETKRVSKVCARGRTTPRTYVGGL